MRVALYARVSTQDQDCERQLRDLRQFAQRRDDQIISTITEQASGSKDDRSGRKEILQLAQAKQIDAILVTELSRWGRSTTDLLSTLEQLESFGVSLIAMTGMTFDLTSATGKLMATMLAGISEFERSLLQERIRSGLDNARSAGKTLGRPAGSSTTNKYKKRVLKCREEGKSYRWIAKDLQISKNTVAKIVKSAETEEQSIELTDDSPPTYLDAQEPREDLPVEKQQELSL